MNETKGFVLFTRLQIQIFSITGAIFYTPRFQGTFPNSEFVHQI